MVHPLISVDRREPEYIVRSSAMQESVGTREDNVSRSVSSSNPIIRHQSIPQSLITNFVEVVKRNYVYPKK